MEPFGKWLLARVDITFDGCWAWSLSRTAEGYGRAWFNGRNWKAHRLVLAMNGVDIEGLEVDHTCGHPFCVNPAHLEAVDPRVNQRRKTRREAPSLDQVVRVVTEDRWEDAGDALYELAAHYVFHQTKTGRPGFIHFKNDGLDAIRVVKSIAPSYEDRIMARNYLINYLYDNKRNDNARRLLAVLKGARYD